MKNNNNNTNEKTTATKRPSKRQRKFLDKNGLDPDKELSASQAHTVIGEFIDACRLLDPTTKQVKFLKRHKKWREGMKRGEAWDTIMTIYGIKPR